MEDIHNYQCFDVENGIHFYEGTAIGLIHSDDIAPSVLFIVLYTLIKLVEHQKKPPTLTPLSQHEKNPSN